VTESGTDHIVDGSDWSVVMPVALDLNPDPRIVEVEVSARQALVEMRRGVMTESWTYEGAVPGPMIEANVGDRLIVHYRNDLPEKSTIHWHGVELPAVMDGTLLAQEAVEPGGTFTYEFDLLTAATYWYHPHVRGHEQVERGQYGALVVRDPAEDAALGLPAQEHTLLIDDVLLEADGSLAPTYPDDPAKRAEAQVNGREGNVLLVNGRELPTLEVAANTPLRLRMVNAANARFFRVSLPHHQMVRIGGDGGLASAAIGIDPVMDMDDGGEHGGMSDTGGGHMGGMAAAPKGGLLLVPGERADVVLTPKGEPGDELFVMWHDTPRGLHSAKRMDDGSLGFEHGHMDGKRPAQKLLRLVLVGPGKHAGHAVAAGAPLRDIQAIDATGAATLPVHFGHGMPDDNGDVMFFAAMKNGMGIPFSELQVEDALHAKIGETRVWEVVNMTGGDHPFHPHGFFFQHLETEFIDMDNPDHNEVVKPAVLVPRRRGAKGRSRTIVRLAVTFDATDRTGLEAFGKSPSEGLSGGWIAHCHILEHADRGMVTWLNLTGADAPSP
jgi:FtsP/CotA-like multicopper oxidase with cupredoxin domain